MSQAPEGLHPVDGAPSTSSSEAKPDPVELLRDIYGPLERGESGDFKPFFDALADDVSFKLSVGELHGKQAVIDYFSNAGEVMEFHPFETPLEYYGDGDRVVIVGDETFRVKQTGATHTAEWAWVYEVRDGLITRIVGIEDLSGVADALREVVAKAARRPGKGGQAGVAAP